MAQDFSAELLPELDVLEVDVLDVLELDSELFVLLDSFEPLSFEDADDSDEDEDDGVAGPLVDDDEERESVMYQPLPLKTMPTG